MGDMLVLMLAGSPRVRLDFVATMSRSILVDRDLRSTVKTLGSMEGETSGTIVLAVALALLVVALSEEVVGLVVQAVIRAIRRLARAIHW